MSARRTRVCDAAVQVLREWNAPAVMRGDSGLLHLIASRASLRPRPRACQTETAVLNALSKRPGELVSAMTRTPRGRWVRIFWLPEAAPGAEA